MTTKLKPPSESQTKPTTEGDEAARALTMDLELERHDVVEFVPFGSEQTMRLTAEDVRTLVANKTKHGTLPDDKTVRLFLKLCKRLQLDPFIREAYLLGYQKNKTDAPEWSLIVAHGALLSRIDAKPDYLGKKSGVIVFNADMPGKKEYVEGCVVSTEVRIIGGWCEMHRKDRLVERHEVLLKSFDKSYQGDYNWWSKDPGMMIEKCAQGKAGRHTYPGILSQAITQEEHDLHRAEPVQIPTERAKPDEAAIFAPDPPKTEKPAATKIPMPASPNAVQLQEFIVAMKAELAMAQTTEDVEAIEGKYRSQSTDKNYQDDVEFSCGEVWNEIELEQQKRNT